MSPSASESQSIPISTVQLGPEVERSVLEVLRAGPYLPLAVSPDAVPDLLVQEMLEQEILP